MDMETSDTDKIVEEVTRPVVKLLVAVIGLKIFESIVVKLPGLGTSIPETPISFVNVAVAIIALVMSGILVNFGREVEPRLNRALAGPDDIVSDLAGLVKYMAFLAAIIVVHGGLRGIVVPFIVDDPWLYNVSFLLIALGPTAIIAQRIFGNIETITDIITEQVKSVTVDRIICPSCSESVQANLESCPECGDEITTAD